MLTDRRLVIDKRLVYKYLKLDDKKDNVDYQISSHRYYGIIACHRLKTMTVTKNAMTYGNLMKAFCHDRKHDYNSLSLFRQ